LRACRIRDRVVIPFTRGKDLFAEDTFLPPEMLTVILPEFVSNVGKFDDLVFSQRQAIEFND